MDAGRVTPVVLTVMDIPVVFTMTAGVFVNALVNVILCAVGRGVLVPTSVEDDEFECRTLKRLTPNN